MIVRRRANPRGSLRVVGWGVVVIIFVVGSSEQSAVHDGVAKQARKVGHRVKVAAELAAGGVFEGVTSTEARVFSRMMKHEQTEGRLAKP